MPEDKEELKKENKEEKKNKKTQEIVPKEDYDELDDRYKRILAEFENYKKRSSKDRENLYNSILSDVVEIILPVLDNLENASKVETKDENYKQGVELVLKQFKDVLKSKGIEEIKTEGETFDPELHEAVSSIQDDNSILSDVVEIILPVLDNLENAAKVETKDENYKQGVELVLKQFKDVLKSKGIEEIKTEGETFDPELHEAVSSIQDENLGEKEIAQEYRKGYKLGNKVIRHSMVVVAN